MKDTWYTLWDSSSANFIGDYDDVQAAIEEAAWIRDNWTQDQFGSIVLVQGFFDESSDDIVLGRGSDILHLNPEAS